MIQFFDQELDNFTTGSFKYAFEDTIKYNFDVNKNSYLIVQFPHMDVLRTNRYSMFVSDANRKTTPITECTSWTYGKVGDLNSVVFSGSLDDAIQSFKVFLGNEIRPNVSLSDPSFLDEMFLVEYFKIDMESDNLTDVVVYNGIIPTNIEPVANAIAKNSFNTPQFSATISWEPAIVGETFSEGVIYTANCTLVPASGFTLVGVDSSIFTINTINPSTLFYANNILSITFTST